MWLVSVYQLDLILTQTLSDWPSEHIVGSAAGCPITVTIAVVSFSRQNWPGLSVMAELGLSALVDQRQWDDFTTVLASLSHPPSDSAWQGSSILINLIIQLKKSCSLPFLSSPATVRLPHVTAHHHVTHHPSSSPVTLKAIFLVTSILRAYRQLGWVLNFSTLLTELCNPKFRKLWSRIGQIISYCILFTQLKL